MTFRYGGSTFAFMWAEDAETTMNRLSKHGYRDFDVFLTPPSFWPAGMSGGERSALRHRLERADLSIESVNFPNYDYNPVAPTEAMRAFTTRLLAEQIPFCSELGIGKYIIIPGRYGLSSPPFSVVRAWLQACFDVLLPIAERAGVQLVIENVPSTALPSVRGIIDFVGSYDHPSLGFCYDVANAEFVGDEHLDLLRRGSRWLSQVHFSDATRTKWAHDPVGKGTVDFEGIGRTLTEIGFSAVAINEVRGTPREDAISDSQATLTEQFGWPRLEHAPALSDHRP